MHNPTLIDRRAVIYRRVSGKTQEENESLRAQQLEAQAYAKRVGLQVVGTEYDVMSGAKTDERPGLSRVRELFRNGEAAHLVVWKLDRLSRADNDDVEAVLMERELKKLGVTTHITTFGRAFGDSAEDQLVIGMVKVFAAHERRGFMDRSALGRTAKAKRGAYIGNGVPPYGYGREGEKGSVELVISNDQAAVVRSIFAWYVVGDGGEALTVRQIMDRLTSTGVPAPGERRHAVQQADDEQPVPGPQKPWGNRKRGAGQWSENTIYQLLDNPTYKGMAPFRRYGRRDGKVFERDEAERTYIPVPAIVTPELWDAAQAKRAVGRANSKRNRKYEYLMARRLICSCGYSIGGGPNHKKDRHGRTHVYFRYTCLTKRRAIVASGPCSLPAVPVDVLDGIVWEWVNTLLQDEEQLQADLERRQRDGGKQRDEIEAAIKDEMKAVLAIEQKQERILDALADGVITKAAYEKKNAAFEQQRSDIQTRIEKLQQRSAAVAAPPPTETVVQAVRNLRQRADNATFEDKRFLIDVLNVTAELAPAPCGNVHATIACEVAVQEVCVELGPRS